MGDHMNGKELEQACVDWLKVKEGEGRRPATLKTYREHVAIVLRWLGDRELDAPTFVQFFREYGKAHSPASSASIYNSLKLLLKHLDRVDLAGNMRRPSGDIPPKSVYSAGTLRTLDKVLRADETAIGLRDGAIVAILRHAGLRAGEVVALTLDDLSEDSVIVRNGKSRFARRIVPLTPPAPQALTAYLGRGRPKLLRRTFSNLLFLQDDGSAITKNTLRMMLRRRGEQVGVHLSPHKFRHTFVSTRVVAGIPPSVVGALAGWSPKTLAEMLSVYSHVSLEELRAAQQQALGG